VGNNGIILHGVGSQVTLVTNPTLAHQPPPPFPGEYLVGVAVGPSGDVWIVGNIGILHEVGGQVTLVSSPTSAFLTSAVVGPSGNVWVTGYGSPGGIILHQVGTQWTLFTNPTEQGGPAMTSVAVGPGGDVWAVGYGGKILAYIDSWLTVQV
jgi:streptogramin lyase